ncbi:response regulator [Marinobacterium jannaschii]|uniref:response regulator n=1 Tax=Marinobacterium jannaschii TaxID=64970 RepID=UPI00048442F7|nr:response regulator [Marinobacterium jannaschii]
MSPIQILAVDDQISSLLALEDVLGTIDAKFIKATSAKEALLIMLNRSVDCVLLDVSMPEMDGFEFLKTLRNAPAHAKIPVIMITGKVFSENETLKAYQYGAVDFLLKPLDPQTVYRKVSFIVQQARRIKSIEKVEQHLNNLGTGVIMPLDALLGKEGLQHYCNELTELSLQLKELDASWQGIRDAK